MAKFYICAKLRMTQTKWGNPEIPGLKRRASIRGFRDLKNGRDTDLGIPGLQALYWTERQSNASIAFYLYAISSMLGQAGQPLAYRPIVSYRHARVAIGWQLAGRRWIPHRRTGIIPIMYVLGASDVSVLCSQLHVGRFNCNVPWNMKYVGL